MAEEYFDLGQLKLSNNHFAFIINHLLDNGFNKDSKILDFGCGDGEFVQCLTEKGYQIRGADTYYDGNNITLFKGISLKDKIDIIKNGTLPYSEGSFDFISSIQVFEHVKDLNAAFNEINRVLKRGGKIVASFPLKYCWIEGHYRIPFSHWFTKGSKIRKVWALLFYKSGFGVKKGLYESFDSWYKGAFDFIDNYCFYRTKSEVIKITRELGLQIIWLDKERLVYKLSSTPDTLSKLMLPIVRAVPSKIVTFIMQNRGSVTIQLVKN
jgi:SAM-dependent methyltransferase